MIAYTSDQTQICGLCRDDYLDLSYGSTHTESLSCIAKSLIQIDINLKNRIQTGKLVQGRGRTLYFLLYNKRLPKSIDDPLYFPRFDGQVHRD